MCLAYEEKLDISVSAKEVVRGGRRFSWIKNGLCWLKRKSKEKVYNTCGPLICMFVEVFSF